MNGGQATSRKHQLTAEKRRRFSTNDPSFFLFFVDNKKEVFPIRIEACLRLVY
jgi:hypothetical protein